MKHEHTLIELPAVLIETTWEEYIEKIKVCAECGFKEVTREEVERRGEWTREVMA